MLGLIALTLFGSVIDEGYTAHEWGTFNQLEGCDGVDVDGLQHEDEPLPDFVERRLPRTPSPYRIWGDTTSHVHARHVNTKMETPVIYFHSAQARRLHVDVTWTHGLLSEWYPAASIVEPAAPLPDVHAIQRSRLAWDLDVLAPSATPPLQPVAAGEPWALARDVDANAVMVGDQAERYVFYRGIGAQLITAHVYSDGDALLVTTSTPGAVILEVGKSTIKWRELRAMSSAEGLLRVGPMTTSPRAQGIRDVSAVMHRLLVAQGLNDDEATAMVNTWTRTWFSRTGKRMLYLVPRATVDDVLPLSITPPPKELVRVFVGRLEYQTPDDQQKLIDDVMKDDKRALAARGRFLEPMLRAALSHEESAEKQRAIERVLGDIGSP